MTIKRTNKQQSPRTGHPIKGELKKTMKKALKMLDEAGDLAIPELLFLLADSTTREERDAYRDYVGAEFNFQTGNKLSRLQKLLNATCSETARELGTWRQSEAKIETERAVRAGLRRK